jgi:hypothetical protein
VSISRECVIGWRTWSVVDAQLASPRQGNLWPASGLAAVRCKRCRDGRDCHCGINAFAHPWQIAGSPHYFEPGGFVGSVSLSGEVRTYRKGFRADRGQPHTLWAMDDKAHEIGHDIARRYGAAYAGRYDPDDLTWQLPAWQRTRALLRALALPTAAALALLLITLAGPRPYSGVASGSEMLVGMLIALPLWPLLTMRWSAVWSRLPRTLRKVWPLVIAGFVALAFAASHRLERAQRTHQLTPAELVAAMADHQGADESLAWPGRRLGKLTRQRGENYSLPSSKAMAAALRLTGPGIECAERARSVWCAADGEVFVHEQGKPVTWWTGDAASSGSISVQVGESAQTKVAAP